MMNTAINRFAGAVGGFIAGAIAVVVIRSAFDLGITLLPFGKLLADLAPGLIIGTLLGFCFPKLFSWLTAILPTD